MFRITCIEQRNVRGIKMNKLADLFNDRSINVSAFARNNGIPPTTLYNVLKTEKLGRTGIDVFIKIAHGLGMTADELIEVLFDED